jgi:membrane protein YqaA with SNARE-associated domain
MVNGRTFQFGKSVKPRARLYNKIMLSALAALFLWSFLAATVLPLGSELPLGAYVRQYEQIALPVFVATVGNYLGSCTTYWLARRAAKLFDKTQALQQSDSRAARLIRRFGQPALLLSWVPIIGDAIVALAGGLKMGFVGFSLWTALGKLLRYIAVAWAASAW